jgi:hypothetical protein
MKTRRNNFYRNAKNATYRVKNGLKSVGSSVETAARSTVPVVKKGLFNLFGFLKSGVNNTTSSLKSMMSKKRHNKRRHNKSKSYRRKY